jgi:hypothetical protein
MPPPEAQVSVRASAVCQRSHRAGSRTWPCTACVRRDCAVLCPDGCQRTETKGSRQREILTLLTRIQDLERALAAERAAKGLPDVEPAAEPSAPVDAIGLLSVSGDERSRYLGPCVYISGGWSSAVSARAQELRLGPH